MMLGDIFYRGGDASYIYPFPISAARFSHRATQHNPPPNLVTRAPAQTMDQIYVVRVRGDSPTMATRFEITLQPID